jgi:sterol desaturase/sphingolipid hydroxylase (fatty acid hydroxylase superfamily)
LANIRHLLLIFVVVQSSFIVLDGYEVWRRNGRPRRREIVRQHGGVIGFLALVWLGYFAIQGALFVALPSIERTLSWFAERFGVESAAEWTMSGLVGFYIGTYLVAGFWDYVIHRWILHTRAFWFLHENHHLPTEVSNVIPGISVRPYVAPTTFLTYVFSIATIVIAARLLDRNLPSAVYGTHLPVLLLVLALVGSASHSCFLRRWGWIDSVLRRLLVTSPQEHLLHHAADLNGNYGNFMMFWDRVFGTYLDPRRFATATLRTGLPYDQDFLGTLTAGKWKLGESWRRKYRLSAVCYLEDSRVSAERDDPSACAMR